MRPVEQWIWLPQDMYPNHQTTRYSERTHKNKETNYTVAAFERTYRFPIAIAEVQLRFSGDTAFALFCNGDPIANGPVLAGGDFLDLYADVPLPQHYATEMTLTAEQMTGFSRGDLSFYAQVRMMPVKCFDHSHGRGGFFLTAHIRFADGTKTVVYTDSSWSARVLTAYTAPGCYDNSLPAGAAVAAEPVMNIWHCETAPIPPCTLTRMEPLEGGTLVIPAGQKLQTLLTFDKIYAGYLSASANVSGPLRATVWCRELEERGTPEQYSFVRSGSYLGLELHSAGCLWVEAENSGKQDALLTLTLITSHYPADTCARTITSDPELNQVLDTCIHTLKYCRQSIHLDSPRHCELLACTGDYYIESLMTAFSFGDLRLAAFDVRRTAELLRYRDGRMFHTTYSLIWVQMLMDVYRLTGERELLTDCEDALTVLLERFHTYLGDNGILENPPDYMFIDWLVPDGISLHHPPKALGQTCLNLYYYGALKTAREIYTALGEKAMAQRYGQRMEALHQAILANLYDADRALFFEGQNTPTREDLIGEWMPRNVEKRYYRKHANILAAYFGFFDRETSADLLLRILQDDSLGVVQPYFCHFLLEAVYRNGLRETYTRPILEQWKDPVRDCPKGLAEGFYKPEESYSFDHSHAWGGTPAYTLPLALTGLEILEPGFKRIRLNPSLLGLTYAHVQIPTPYGMIEVKMQDGTEPEIAVPDGILLEI